MIEQSPEIQSLAVALLQFQSEVRGVLKNAKNPHFKNRYASLEAVVEAARPGLQSAGIVFLQGPGNVVGNTLEVSTMLIHAASGQWIRSTMQIPMAKIDPQGAGSAVTYAQRYSLMAALGIPPVEHLDDDAETAMGRGDTNRPLDRREPPKALTNTPRASEPNDPRRETDAFGLPPVPVEDKKEPTDAQAYVSLAKTAINNALSSKELDQWWTDEADKRRSYGIRGGKDQSGEIDGTPEYLELVKAFADRKAELRPRAVS